MPLFCASRLIFLSDPSSPFNRVLGDRSALKGSVASTSSHLSSEPLFNERLPRGGSRQEKSFTRRTTHGWSGDGVNDPNLPGAVTVLHIQHVIQADPSLAALASLPMGHIAKRDQPGRPWVISAHEWSDEP